MQLAIIGAGAMGEVFASLLVYNNIIEPEELCLVERSPERIRELNFKFPRALITPEINEYFIPDIIFLSVKPQDFGSIISSLKVWCEKNPLIISIMTGISMESLQNATNGSKRVIRAMPNMPFMFAQGATAFIVNEGLSDADKGLFTLLFEKTGITVELKSEEQIDAVTALSASGPGYIALLYNHLLKGAIAEGLPEEDADLLLRQTFHGFLSMLDNGLAPKEITKLVASKGGTTEAAIDSLKENKVHKALEEAVSRATQRARELRATG